MFYESCVVLSLSRDTLDSSIPSVMESGGGDGNTMYRSPTFKSDSKIIIILAEIPSFHCIDELQGLTISTCLAVCFRSDFSSQRDAFSPKLKDIFPLVRTNATKAQTCHSLDFVEQVSKNALHHEMFVANRHGHPSIVLFPSFSAKSEEIRRKGNGKIHIWSGDLMDSFFIGTYLCTSTEL